VILDTSIWYRYDNGFTRMSAKRHRRNVRAVAAAGDTVVRHVLGAVDRTGSRERRSERAPAEPPLGRFLADPAL
jgi:hypothetical protein